MRSTRTALPLPGFRGTIFGNCPALKSNARNVAGSSTRSGQEVTATHTRGRRASSQFGSWISRNQRPYTLSNVSGNSSKACTIRPGRHLTRRAGNHFNLPDTIKTCEEMRDECFTCRLLFSSGRQSQAACLISSLCRTASTSLFPKSFFTSPTVLG